MKLFQGGDGAPRIDLLFNSVGPGDDLGETKDNAQEWDWVTSHVQGSFGIKNGALSRGHHLVGERSLYNQWMPYLVDPKGLTLFRRSEMDQTWQKTWYQLNVPLNVYWGAINALFSIFLFDLSGGLLGGIEADHALRGRALDLALEHGARFFIASTSEVYGDPLVHPQPEYYWGNVNPVGPRSIYDEAKRFAETLTMAYRRYHGLSVAIARIFNTYGPRLRPGDGRVVSNFLVQAMQGRPVTVYGDGSQTRSFCFVSDEVRGLLALLDSQETGPVNIGNPNECSMLDLARMVIDLTESSSEVVYEPLPADDPRCRRPDITRARDLLGWAPTVDLREGLRLTYESFLEEARRNGL